MLDRSMFLPGYVPEPGAVHYSLVFAQDHTGRVALILKQRPVALKDKWNGIGGKHELSDASIDVTAVRELQEETGLAISTEQLRKYAILYGAEYFVHVYAVMLSTDELYTAKSMTDELVRVYRPNGSVPMDEDARYLYEMSRTALAGSRTRLHWHNPIQAAIFLS